MRIYCKPPRREGTGCLSLRAIKKQMACLTLINHAIVEIPHWVDGGDERAQMDLSDVEPASHGVSAGGKTFECVC